MASLSHETARQRATRIARERQVAADLIKLDGDRSLALIFNALYYAQARGQ